MIYHKVLEKSSGRHYIRAYNNGNMVFHRFKAKTHRWSTKYGRYGVIKERSGSATFYNLGGT
jgi:hypothetical protein